MCWLNRVLLPKYGSILIQRKGPAVSLLLFKSAVAALPLLPSNQFQVVLWWGFPWETKCVHSLRENAVPGSSETKYLHSVRDNVVSGCSKTNRLQSLRENVPSGREWLPTINSHVRLAFLCLLHKRSLLFTGPTDHWFFPYFWASTRQLPIQSFLQHSWSKGSLKRSKGKPGRAWISP